MSAGGLALSTGICLRCVQGTGQAPSARQETAPVVGVEKSHTG